MTADNRKILGYLETAGAVHKLIKEYPHILTKEKSGFSTLGREIFTLKMPWGIQRSHREKFPLRRLLCEKDF